MSKENQKLFNPEVTEFLRDSGIHPKEGLTALTLLYYDLDTSMLPKNLMNKIWTCGIVAKKITEKSLEWRIPLFLGEIDEEKKEEYIKYAMSAFAKVNPDRVGQYKPLSKKFSTFFKIFPHLNGEDVKRGIDHYLSTIEDPRYCMNLLKFVMDEMGNSTLKTHVDNATKDDDRFNFIAAMI